MFAPELRENGRLVWGGGVSEIRLHRVRSDAVHWEIVSWSRSFPTDDHPWKRTGATGVGMWDAMIRLKDAIDAELAALKCR